MFWKVVKVLRFETRPSTLLYVSFYQIITIWSIDNLLNKLITVQITDESIIRHLYSPEK